MDSLNVKEQFPALSQSVYGKPLIYLDSGATSQKPKSVIDAMQHYYERDNSNVNRGVHALSQRADKLFDSTRQKVKTFINSKHIEEIIFTYGTTDGLNLLAHSLGESLQENDEIILTEVEHHANIVPWQMLRDRKNIVIHVVKVMDDGMLDMNHFKSLLSDKTKIVSVSHVSNVLGIENPIREIIQLAHQFGAKVIVDAAQSIAHETIDVQKIDCDFLVFSGHKMYGPTGVGILYGKKEILNAMPPYRGGGSMINEVTFNKTTYAPLPQKFEAGTPPIASVVGLGAAIDFINAIGMQAIKAHEELLSSYLYDKLNAMNDIHILGAHHHRAPIVAFTMDNVHAHDVATILDRQGVAVRAGHHCAMPLMQRFGVSATTRASAGVYNTTEDIDALVYALGNVRGVFA